MPGTQDLRPVAFAGDRLVDAAGRSRQGRQGGPVVAGSALSLGVLKSVAELIRTDAISTNAAAPGGRDMRTMTPIAHRIRSFIGVSGLTLVAAALLPSRFAAALTQDEVLKSISQNVSEQTENHLIEPFFFVALGAIGLIVVFTQWRRRAVAA